MVVAGDQNVARPSPHMAPRRRPPMLPCRSPLFLPPAGSHRPSIGTVVNRPSPRPRGNATSAERALSRKKITQDLSPSYMRKTLLLYLTRVQRESQSKEPRPTSSLAKCSFLRGLAPFSLLRNHCQAPQNLSLASIRRSADRWAARLGLHLI